MIIKPKLITYAKDEEVRIKWFIEYYGGFFDIIVLDGGSSDNTKNICTENNVIFVLRKPGVGLGPLLEYIEFNCTDNDIILFLSLDEFIKIETLMPLIHDVQNDKSKVILGKRIDYIYGKRINRDAKNVMPRVFRKNDVSAPDALHSGLKCHPARNTVTVDVLHLHVQDASSIFDKYALYAKFEIDNFPNFITLRFIKRFIFIELYNALLCVYRERDKGFYFIMNGLLLGILQSLIALVVATEYKLLGRNQQLNVYQKKFKPDEK